MTADDSRTPTELNRPDPDEEKQFLRGSRDNPRELATAGRALVARVAPQSEATYNLIEEHFGAQRLARLLGELHDLGTCLHVG